MHNIEGNSFWKPIICAVLAFTLIPNDASAQADPQNDQKPGNARAITVPDNWDTTSANDRPDWGKVDWNNWETVKDLLEDIHHVSGIPALAAAMVKDGEVIDFATVGVRESGTQQKVTSNDRFHIGSVTKSMTATVIGKLVEEGKLSWKTTVGSVLTDVPMRKVYRKVTIEQLLHHRGGIQTFSSSASYRELAMKQYSGSATEKRSQFLAGVLNLEPVGNPGEVTAYANAGYSLAGYLAERVTGKSWRELIKRHIFDPLEMTNSGFGHPGTASVPNQPRGHAGAGKSFFAVSDSDHPPMDIIAPAGNVHTSIQDLARYAISHLQGLNGEDGYIRSETIKRLHTLAPALSNQMRYASGWRIQKGRNGETIHSHSGTTGTFFAEVKLFPEQNSGVVVLMNVGQGHGELVVNKVGRSLIARYGSANESQSEKPASAGQWSSTSSDSIVVRMDKPASPEGDAHLWEITKGLSEAINNEDLDAYNSYFSKVTSDQESMFTFMASQILPIRGNISSFHGIKQVQVSDSKSPMQMVLFHLENGTPGYFGFELDENGKIERLSLFVKSNICPNGADTECDLIVKTLGKEL